MAEPLPEKGTHAWYDTVGDVSGRLNWLRAAVLGANDGIVSVAALLIGVAGAAAGHGALVTAGIAGLSAGALSMAVGEYVSVSTQRDSELAMLDLERRELAELPEEELAELTAILVSKGINRDTAEVAAREMTEHDAFRAHCDLELGIDPDNLSSNPWQAAGASAVSFLAGGAVPFLAILLAPESLAVVITVAAVVVALALTGYVSARLGRAQPAVAVVRLIAGGLLAMAITFGIGALFGTQVG